MKTFLIAIGVFLFSTSTMANSVWFSSTIKKLYPVANGNVIVMFNEDSPSCTNHNSTKYHYLGNGLNGVTAQGFENIYSALLAAAASKKKVSINFDSSTPDCAINRAIVQF